MTDEEKLAEEYYYETYTVTSNFEEEAIRKKNIMNAFLTGFKAGREIEKEYVKNNAFTSMKEQGLFPFGKWHKVADGDLPKDTRYVWTNVGPSYYDDDKDCPCWRDEFGRTQGVIAWCEPKFEE